MSYGKVILDPVELSMLYQEPVFVNDTRVVLGTSRIFQEYLGAVEFTEGRTLSKGSTIEIKLNFPRYVLDRTPRRNWFQIALSAEEDPLLADPLGCKARYKGFFPGILDKSKFRPAQFILEDEPRYASIGYALFIYDSTDYQVFLDGVANLLGGYLNRGRAIVTDQFGNKILVSSESNQPMLLIPVSLLVGGKDYICKTWDKILTGSSW